MEQLADKTLIMIVGPAAIGKSTLMNEACRIDDRFAYVQSFTTRPDRGDGHSTYRHITEKAAKALHASGAAVTFVRHPTTGDAYGTTAESYPSEFNLLDTLSGSVSLYRALLFKRTVTVSLTANPDDWERWLLTRYPEPSHERTSRLLEAIESVSWSLAQTREHHWLLNVPNELSNTAAHLIAIAQGRSDSNEIPEQAQQLRERAKSLLSYG